MADTNKREGGRRRSEHNHQQQYTQEYKKQYSVKKGAGYGAFGGFIAAISFTGIMLSMPFIFHFPEGTFIYTLGTTVTGIKSDPVISGLAAFSIILIQGIVVGIIFGVVTSKVKALHPSHKKKGVGLGLATGIIAFLVLYLPVVMSVYPQLLSRAFTSYPTAELTTRGIQSYNNMILSSYPKYLPGILGLGALAYLVYGFFMGGIITLAYSVYNFDLMKMKEIERQEKEEEEAKKAKDEKNQK
ncbi:MAG TPA: hypothetical protein VE619_00415 [Nitrososphaeraceae archaeon]|nr:hypothetical protein [Nitrososphaeraceae archaeon]